MMMRSWMQRRTGITPVRPADWPWGDRVWTAAADWALAIQGVGQLDDLGVTTGRQRTMAELRLGACGDRLDRACRRSGVDPAAPTLQDALTAVVVALAHQTAAEEEARGAGESA